MIKRSRFYAGFKRVADAVLTLRIQTRAGLIEVMDFEFNRNIINAAPCLMVLTTVNKRSGYERDGSFSTSKGEHWQSFDAGVAAQTFCLAAYEKGLGTVILGVYNGEKVAEVLEIPEEKSVSALIPIGYPAEEPKAPKRKDVEELLNIR